MTNKKKKSVNYKRIMYVAIAIIILIAVVILITKIFGSSNKSKSTDEHFKFESYSGETKISDLDVTFKKNKITDVTITLYFDSSATAKELETIYKLESSYEKVSSNGNKLIMHYNEDELNKLGSLSNRDDVIGKFQNEGYVYKK